MQILQYNNLGTFDFTDPTETVRVIEFTTGGETFYRIVDLSTGVYTVVPPSQFNFYYAQERLVVYPSRSHSLEPIRESYTAVEPNKVPLYSPVWYQAIRDTMTAQPAIWAQAANVSPMGTLGG